MKKKNDDFELIETPNEVVTSDISDADFVLQQADNSILEQRFQTKPTTFLKDSLKRFRKNKSSVVAAFILGILILLAIFVPIFNTNDVSNAANSALKNLEPKLFNGGGFWDGTVTVRHKEVDYETGYPDPTLYYKSGIRDLVREGEHFTNVPNAFGKGGYIQTGFYGGYGIEESYLYSTNPMDNSAANKFVLNLEQSHLTLTNFVVMDEDMLKEDLGKDGVIPENFKLGLTGLQFVYYYDEEEKAIDLVEPSLTHTIGIDGGESTIELNDLILANEDHLTSFESFYFRFVTSKDADITASDHVCSLIKSMVITTDSDDAKEQIYFSHNADKETGIEGISFTDAMKMSVRSFEVGSGSKQRRNCGYWNIESSTKNFKNIYLAKAVYASFTYDSYFATLGERENVPVSSYDVENYKRKGWVDYTIDIIYHGSTPIIDPDTFEFVILNEAKCPFIKAPQYEDVKDVFVTESGGREGYTIYGDVMYYRYLGYDSMPKFLFGTDKSGRDMFKYVFEGLRNSLLLGVLTFVVCFIIGLIWGAISGYFGGAVDLIMERVTDILSGVPWIVLMTIIILKAGSSFGTFALALCLTGWIGTASTTRTQFYRFRGREYVLASRTLGASDARLIAKHILPNAMGTIITGAVLMIPSVIFSEATISYLGLGFKNLSSLGVILSNNQSELTNHPYQLIFPSVVIALVMISFNLFGNGLRDAINPSLKGEGE